MSVKALQMCLCYRLTDIHYLHFRLCLLLVHLVFLVMILLLSLTHEQSLNFSLLSKDSYK